MVAQCALCLPRSNMLTPRHCGAFCGRDACLANGCLTWLEDTTKANEEHKAKLKPLLSPANLPVSDMRDSHT